MTDEHDEAAFAPGWEKEEGTDYDDYLDGLGWPRVEVRHKDGSFSVWTMTQLREALGLPPEGD